MTPATLRPYLNVNFSEKFENHDNIIGVLSKHFGETGTLYCLINLAVIKTRQEFLKAMQEETRKFKPMGKKISSFTRQVPRKEHFNLSKSEPKAKRKTQSNQ